MATLEELGAALIKADAAGDTASAKILATAIQRLRAAPPSEPSAPVEGLPGPRMTRGQELYAAARPYVAPVVETGGALLGGLVGAGMGLPTGPGAALTGAAGAGLGYAGGRELMRQYDIAAGLTPDTMTRPLQTAQDVATGAASELGGYIAAPMIGRVASATLGAGRAMLPKALGGGIPLYENRAFRAALGDNPELMQRASDLLKQGKTIQEVAVELNSPSLAAFARNAETSFGSEALEAGDIQRRFVLQREAQQQELANQIAAAQQGVQGMQAPVQRQLQSAQQQLTSAQAQANQLAAQAGAPLPAVNALRVQTPETAGEAIRTSALSAQEAAKAPIQARAQAAIEAARGTQAYSRSLATAAQSILDEPVTALMPSTAPETRALLQRAAPKPIQGGLMGVTQVGSTLPTMSLDELDALRRAINSDLARTEQAKVTGAAANAAMTQRNLLTLKDAVDKLITTSPTLAPGAAQEYMGAMRQFGTEYAPAFRSETARKLLGTKFGAPALKPEDVVKKYFAPGSVTEPTEFLRMAQYNPNLLDSMQTGIESLFRREVIEKTGTVDAAKAAEFLRKYQDPLRVLSEGGVDIGNVQAVAQQAAQRAAQTQIAAKQVESATQQIAGTEAKLAALAPLEKRLGALQAKIGKKGVAGAAPQTAQEISSIADEVSKRLATQEGFGALAAEGQRLGVKTVEKPSTVKIPLDIKTEIVINILNKLSGGSLNKELSRDIALKVLDNKATAAAIDRALTAKSAEAVRAVGGKTALRFAPSVINALMSEQPPNNNALAR